MEDNRPAILIAEDQIFIALEAERILSEALDCTIEICRRDQLSSALAEKVFALVVLEFSGNRAEDSLYLGAAQDAGAKVVFLTARNDLADLAQAFPAIPTIRKPFNDAEVTSVVGKLMMTAEFG